MSRVFFDICLFIRLNCYATHTHQDEQRPLQPPNEGPLALKGACRRSAADQVLCWRWKLLVYYVMHPHTGHTSGDNIGEHTTNRELAQCEQIRMTPPHWSMTRYRPAFRWRGGEERLFVPPCRIGTSRPPSVTCHQMFSIWASGLSVGRPMTSTCRWGNLIFWLSMLNFRDNCSIQSIGWAQDFFHWEGGHCFFGFFFSPLYSRPSFCQRDIECHLWPMAVSDFFVALELPELLTVAPLWYFQRGCLYHSPPGSVRRIFLSCLENFCNLWDLQPLINWRQILGVF